MKKNLTLYLLIIILYPITAGSLRSQTLQDPWSRVENKTGQNLRIDLSTIKGSPDNDIFVWCLENHIKPIRIDSVSSSIYKTKTYYLINGSLMKYSILEVMYYDSLNTVLKDFNYRLPVKKPELRYNYSILNASPINSILNKCVEFLKNKNAKNP